ERGGTRCEPRGPRCLIAIVRLLPFRPTVGTDVVSVCGKMGRSLVSPSCDQSAAVRRRHARICLRLEVPQCTASRLRDGRCARGEARLIKPGADYGPGAGLWRASASLRHGCRAQAQMTVHIWSTPLLTVPLPRCCVSLVMYPVRSSHPKEGFGRI